MKSITKKEVLVKTSLTAPLMEGRRLAKRDEYFLSYVTNDMTNSSQNAEKS
jgi:hypothetical protein